MKLYKFRALGKHNDFERVKEIVENGTFWCSKLWDLNDPMEGVYKNSTFDKKSISKLFNSKNDYLVCSFSGEDGFKNQQLWGYYANGFRGVAIEINVEGNDEIIKEVRYLSQNEFNMKVTDVEDIITRKLINWKMENEFRFLKKINGHIKNEQKIGSITGIYFGKPYANLNNTKNIITNSKNLKEYQKYKKELKKICKLKNIRCSDFPLI